MASSRKKSCVQCRKNKARCSQGTPCYHCQERNWDCKYDITIAPQRRRPRALRPIEPDINEVPTDNSRIGGPLRNSYSPSNPALAQPEPSLARLPTSDQGPCLNITGPDILPSPPVILDPLELNFSDTLLNADCLENFGQLLPGTDLSNISNPSSSNFSSLGSVFDLVSTPYSQESQISDSPSSVLDLTSPPLWEGSRQRFALLAPRKLYHVKPFSKLRTSSVENTITTDVLLGQILSYPLMMAGGGHLPPFIFPPCATGGLASYNKCSSGGFHKCLPKSLAICSNLIQSYKLRTQGSVEFIWRNILTELERFSQEDENKYESYSKEELLEALQASIIYLLLQASDLDSVQKHDVALLIATPGDLVRRLHKLCEYESNITSCNGLDRTEWNMRESVRRTICLLYGIELLIDVNLSPTDSVTCDGYSLVPLPCARELWQPLSNEEWAFRLEELERTSTIDHVLKLADLQLYRRAVEPRGKYGRDPTGGKSSISEWSKNLDEFGVLIWMAALLD